MKKLFFLMSVALFTIVGFSSCADDDEIGARVLSGEWQGDWGMQYEDDFGRTYNAVYSYVKFVPAYHDATYGYGIQEDYYSYGPYRYLWYKFDWTVRDGIIYLNYHYEHKLDTYIRDYRLTNDYFSGYFGNSNSSFRLRKLTDWYNWTPEVWVESDYYGWGLWSAASNKFEGQAGSKAINDNLPKIVIHGNRFLDTEK